MREQIVKQIYSKRYNSVFSHNKMPTLLYITNTQGMESYYPRMLHKHNDRLEIVFIDKGQGVHIINGYSYSTKEGDILIFNQGVIHDEVAQQDSELITFCCGITDLKLHNQEMNCLFDTNYPTVIHTGKYKNQVSNILHMMFNTIKEHNEYSVELAHYLLYSLITLILSFAKRVNNLIRPNKLTLVNQVKQYIEQNYSENINLVSLSKTFKVSSSYLSHLFKAEIGLSPIHYLIRCRIGEAQSLLMKTHYSITQIATMVGYNDTNYFSIVFKKMTGITPSYYRNIWKDKEIEI